MGNKIYVSSDLYIEMPSDEIRKWAAENLEYRNPEYTNRYRMGLYTGNVPARIFLYECLPNGDMRMPYGCLTQIPLVKNEEIFTKFHPKKTIDFNCSLPLYAYQQKAVDEAYKAKFGMIVAPTGSGKTQMGIGLVAKWGLRTLWLTHTRDLLEQSKERAIKYLGADRVGEITTDTKHLYDRKGFFVATIQTMYRMDPSLYRNWFDLIIVDECHHVAGSYNSITMYQTVLNSLNARHKYGLTATLHRSDGLIGTAKMLLGNVCATVEKDDCKDTIVQVGVKKVDTGVELDRSCLNTDGTMNYANTIYYLCNHEERNRLIITHMLAYCDYSSLILTHRVEHLYTLQNLLPEWMKKDSAVIHAKTKLRERNDILNRMRTGELKYLFATYGLAKEGLDIPKLERLYLVTPQKDYGIITQCIGRIARKEDKADPICVDFVDNIGYFRKIWVSRRSVYRKNDCYILEGEDEQQTEV